MTQSHNHLAQKAPKTWANTGDVTTASSQDCFLWQQHNPQTSLKLAWEKPPAATNWIFSFLNKNKNKIIVKKKFDTATYAFFIIIIIKLILGCIQDHKESQEKFLTITACLGVLYQPEPVSMTTKQNKTHNRIRLILLQAKQ